MPRIAIGVPTRKVSVKATGQTCGDMVYALEVITHSKHEMLGAKIGGDSAVFHPSWQRVVVAIGNIVAKNSSEKQRAENDKDKEWLGRFQVSERRIGCVEANPHFWIFDGQGVFVDGTKPPPRGDDAPWPRPKRRFAVNEIVATVFDEEVIPGVIVGKREVVLDGEFNYEEFDVQCAITRPEGEAWRGWVGRAHLYALRREDIEDYHLFWVALELLDEKVLDEAVVKLRHIIEDPRPPKHMEILAVIQRSLSGSDGQQGFLDLTREIIIATPQGKKVIRQLLGLFRGQEEILRVLADTVAKDEHKDWHFTGTELPPPNLVLRYIISAELLAREPETETVAKDDSSEESSPFVFLDPDRVREDGVYDYSWFFDRKGQCLGRMDWSELLYYGTPKAELAFQIGDIVGYRKSETEISPMVITCTPPEKARPRAEMSDEYYFVEDDVVRPCSWSSDFDDVREADIILFEGPISDVKKRRLARLLASAQAKEIVAHFRFHGET